MRIVLLALLLAAPCPGQVVIQEWVAANQRGITDRDGSTADWIELHNTSEQAHDLSGHYLTDSPKDLTRWRFPAVTMPPKGYLLVFASGKDRRAPTAPLHTNFRLAQKAGRILLVRPDGKTQMSAVEFGAQRHDVSQGFAQPHRASTLLAADARGRWLVPRAKKKMPWTAVDFDDSRWLRGRGGFGFDRKIRPTLTQWIRTNTERGLRGVNTSIYYRFPLQVESAARFDVCVLRMRCVAGFVAYLNGAEITRRRAPRATGFDASAEVDVQPRDPARPDSYEIPMRLLRDGKNVLAIHALTDVEDAREHLLEVEVRGYEVDAPDRRRIVSFARPTPNRPNGTGFAAVTERPKIQPKAALVVTPVRVTLTAARSADVIRYTLDGSIPGENSRIYDGPITIAASTELRARAFGKDAMPSAVAHGVYTKVAPDVARFDSNLPLVVVHTFGREIPNKEFATAHVHVVDRSKENSRCSLASKAEYSGLGALKVRGSSTLDRPKKAYGLELRKQDGTDRRAKLVGLPAHSDWVLYGPHNYDQSHLRNALCYELARRIGLDAPRARFVEVFVSEENRSVQRKDYRGLYLLVERVSPEMDRLDLRPPGPREVTEPSITGDYLLKIDRPGPGDMGFESHEEQIQFVSPKERDITDPQRKWLQNWFDRFHRTLSGPSFAAPNTGYTAWIDVDNFIDYHFFSEFVKNPDAFTLSTYFYKKRGKKLRMGPVWDYDRALRTNDEDYWVGRPSRPTGWTGDTGHGWWGKLFRDEGFGKKYRARGRALLQGTFAVEKVHALIDELAKEIAEAEVRDRLRWPIIEAGGWENEILELKQWVTARTKWLRSESIDPPEFFSSNGSTTPPTRLEIKNADPTGVIYYTLDGADPRRIDGSVSSHAKVYSGEIQLEKDVQVQARVLVKGTWSPITQASFVKSRPKLAITEIMFNPDGGRNFEFFEVLNYGSEPADLRGIKVTGTVRFYFSLGDVKTLGPGQRLVVVRDRQIFADRYGTQWITIAGEYLGRMDNFDGTLTLTGPVGEDIATAEYDSDWVEGTDGDGYSLVAAKNAAELTKKSSWKRSRRVFGTPGR